MPYGSQDMRIFRRAIRDGATMEQACEAAGYVTTEDGRSILMISHEEARIILKMDAANPPPPEAYELLYDPDAVAAASQPEKEPAMGRTARPKATPASNEVPQKDFAGAVKIYRQDIKPAKTKQGEFGQEQSTAYKAIKKGCHIQPGAAKIAFNIAEMEEAHRDDFLICLNGLLKELKIVMPRDLVTIAEGSEGGSIIPEGERPKPKLVTIAGDPDLPLGQPATGDETDLAEAGEADDDEFTEASPEELAAQRDRPGNDDDEEQAEAAE